MHIMLDLETMGTRPSAPILAIGACAFDPRVGTTGLKFYRVVNLESAVAGGGVIDPNTVMWWMRQPDEAREALFKCDAHFELKAALHDFADFVHVFRVLSNEAPVYIWGNGVILDNNVLAEAYRRLGMTVPWTYKEDRCYRTLRGLRPDIEFLPPVIEHHALQDAIAQAEHAIRLMTVLGLEGAGTAAGV